MAPADPSPVPRRRRTLGQASVARSVAVAVGVLALAGCTLDQTGPPSGRMTAWLTSAGAGAAIGQVEVDGRNVDLALARHQPASAIRTVCALLTTDAQTAIGNLPTPDSTVTDQLNAAYEDAAAAGNDCYSGASGNARLLRRSAAERSRIASMLSTAVDSIEAITGHAPATSTTLAPNVGDDPFAPNVVTGPVP